MNVRRLIQIGLVKADSIPANTQNGRHTIPHMLQRVKDSLRSLALAVPGGTAAYRWCAAALGRWRFRRMFPGLASATDATTIFDHFYRTNP